MDSIFEDFVIEAVDLITEVEEELLNIQDSPSLAESYKLIFRNLHSLKGSSGMIGLTDLQRHTHMLEDYFSKFQNNLDGISDSVDFLLQGIDGCRDLLEGRKSEFIFTEPASNPKSDGYATKFTPNTSAAPEIYLVGQKSEFKECLKAFSGYSICNFKDTSLFANSYKDVHNAVIVSTDEFMAELKEKVDHTKNEVLSIENVTDAYAQQAIEKIYLKKHVNKSILLLLYQMSDLEDFLRKNNKIEILKSIKGEMNDLLEFRGLLRKGPKK